MKNFQKIQKSGDKISSSKRKRLSILKVLVIILILATSCLGFHNGVSLAYIGGSMYRVELLGLEKSLTLIANLLRNGRNDDLRSVLKNIQLDKLSQDNTRLSTIDEFNSKLESL